MLELWVTNDRVTWSPEAFEAVKLLLAERGVKELAPQNEPAPVATTYRTSDDPVARYWLGWLRPVLWMCCAITAASLPRVIVVIWALSRSGGRSFTVADAWRAAGTFELWLRLIVSDLALPILLGVGAVAALRLRPWGRAVLLSYAVIAAVNGVAAWALSLWDMQRYAVLDMWTFTGSESVNSLVKSLVFPAILWLLLRRPEIRSLFTPMASGHAFEPLRVSDAVPNSTAR